MSSDLNTAIILFIFGFVLLLKGANILTDAAAGLAKALGIANFTIGVVVVGIGTSLPELVITLLSNTQGFSSVGAGTVIGSNLFNTLFIIGAATLVAPLSISRGEALRHLPANTLSVVIVGLFALIFGGISRLLGIVLIILFFLWVRSLRSTNQLLRVEEQAPEAEKTKPRFVNTLHILGGLIGLIIGGQWITESVATMVRMLPISESTIGLTLLGISTSLPELMASLVAALKKNYGIAIGNVIGSNIFDFLMILGVAAAMKPIRFSEELTISLWITALATLLLFGSLFIGKRYTVSRFSGVVFIALYGVYLYFLITSPLL